MIYRRRRAVQAASTALLVAVLTTGVNAQTTVRTSGTVGEMKKKAGDTSSAPYHWAGTSDAKRTIYNPLDGGVLLHYTGRYGASDGCSEGDILSKEALINACLWHDLSYDAPFGGAPAGGKPFLAYKSGASIGKDLADYLFYLDMLDISRTTGNGALKVIAPSWFGQVQLYGKYRNQTGNTVHARGGVFAVKNKGAYHLRCRVKWIDPQNKAREVEVGKDGGQRALVVPLSLGSRNIDTECWAVAGTQIFRKTFPRVGDYGFTVYGTTLIHKFEETLQD